MAWLNSTALEKVLMDRWVINPPRIKNSSVNKVSHLLNERNRISKHNFSIPTSYGLEHTTGESYFAGHMTTKKSQKQCHFTCLCITIVHKCINLFMKYSGRLTEREGGGKKE